MSIPGNSILAPRGLGPMLVHGVTRREFRACFKSRPMVSDRAYRVSGNTRDSAGAALAGCLVQLFYTGDDTPVAKVLSGADGSYSFSVGPNLSYYVVAYKAGAPDVAGTTVNVLAGA